MIGVSFVCAFAFRLQYRSRVDAWNGGGGAVFVYAPGLSVCVFAHVDESWLEHDDSHPPTNQRHGFSRDR